MQTYLSKPTTTTYSNLIIASLYVSTEGNLPTKMREANVICVRLKGSQALFINGWENTSWGQLLNEKSIKYNLVIHMDTFWFYSSDLSSTKLIFNIQWKKWLLVKLIMMNNIYYIWMIIQKINILYV